MHMIALTFAALLVQVTPLPSPAPAASTAPAAPTTQQVQPQTGNQADFGELISSLNNMRSEIAKVQSMNGTSVNNVKPVNVAQLNGANPSALNNAITHNQAQLSRLRNTLGRVTVTTAANEHITVAQFLADNRMTLTQIVGVDVKNGTMLLFYQRP